MAKRSNKLKEAILFYYQQLGYRFVNLSLGLNAEGIMRTWRMFCGNLAKELCTVIENPVVIKRGRYSGHLVSEI